MTDLEKEMMRQIHELDKEVKQLRERVAVVESTSHHHHGNGILPVLVPPFRVTC